MEEVLVFERYLLDDNNFQGFVKDHPLRTKLFECGRLYLYPKNLAETDPSRKQLIPYCLIRLNDKYFVYERGKSGGENRLHTKLSLGCGGHCNQNDVSWYKAEYGQFLYSCIKRELKEELGLESYYMMTNIGFLNDDSNDVGKVHFGMVNIIDLKENNINWLENCIVNGKFWSLGEIKENVDRFENWSQIIVKEYLCTI